jgi:HSP20 family molecular chaperone IbpA
MWWMTEDRTGLSPFSRLGRLERELNRLFEGAAMASFPALDMKSDAEKVELKAELPGVEAKDLKVSVLGDQLSIEAELKPENGDEKAVWHRQERPTEISRAFVYPARRGRGQANDSRPQLTLEQESAGQKTDSLKREKNYRKQESSRS